MSADAIAVLERIASTLSFITGVLLVTGSCVIAAAFTYMIRARPRE